MKAGGCHDFIAHEYVNYCGDDLGGLIVRYGRRLSLSLLKSYLYSVVEVW